MPKAILKCYFCMEACDQAQASLSKEEFGILLVPLP
jgi:hypothetical protein